MRFKQRSSPGLLWMLVLAVTMPVNAETQPSAERFTLPDDLVATVWASAPMFYNPTNIDVDECGRVWVAEAVNYRDFNTDGNGRLKHVGGDRILILEDTDHDGTADTSTVFVQDIDLVAPLGIAVFENRVIVSCSPNLIVYTDTNRDCRFDVKDDHKEVLLTGFGGVDHDHGLHAVIAGPDGRWHFNVGNAGPHIVTDRSGWTLRSGSWYTGGTPHNDRNTPGLKSDDGRVYVGGLAMSIEPDGTGLAVFAHNCRNNYEICLDSFGNVFQNDNDDQVVACRTSWLMQSANVGYSSVDGQRSWQADRRPGQSIATAHWHQDDPGVQPCGDLYGAGAPTGMVVYEGDGLGPDYRGMLLSCDAGRNVVFGYRVRLDGAGYDLHRTAIFGSGLPDNPDYQWNKVEQDPRAWFRPSDVAVGTDGAIYVADWHDPIVGGHAMHDRVGAGVVYRIAPKGRVLTAPRIDLNTLDGQLAALKSPAPNVRYAGFVKLQRRGEAACGAVQALLADDNPYLRARAAWLLAQLGDAGQSIVSHRINDPDPQQRVVALRALRRSHADVLPYAQQLAGDSSPAVRREVAIAMRDIPLAACQEILAQLAKGSDGDDRWYLEALGTACEGKEEALYPMLQEQLGAAPQEWNEQFARIVWRLHPRAAIESLSVRASSADLTAAQRKLAIDTLAFIQDVQAAEAMADVAALGPNDLRDYATWWLDFRRHNLWHDYAAVHQPTRDAVSVGTVMSGVQLPEKAAYTSEVIGRGNVAEILVDITGAQHLYLVVMDAGDGQANDWADWSEPRLLSADAERQLTELQWDHATAASGKARVNTNCVGLPLKIDGRSIPYGIGTHAPSVIVYNIGGRGFQWFAARGGLDNGRHDLGGTDNTNGSPSVVFQVFHDGPTPEARARELESILFDENVELTLRADSAMVLARSKLGGTRLLSLAAQSNLPAEVRPFIADAIHRNPDLSVRALAGQYFPRATRDGESFPTIEELVKLVGDAERGRDLVAGRAQCVSCHVFGKLGKSVGPNLTDIGQKLDRMRLFDALLNPSASISFGYEPWLIETKDGRVITGFVVGEGDVVVLMDAQGKQHTVPASSIEFRQRQHLSIMPEVATMNLTAQELADIVSYLLDQSSG